MRSFARGSIVLCVLMALPAMAFAQEAVLTGTITDSTGAVLPGARRMLVRGCPKRMLNSPRRELPVFASMPSKAMRPDSSRLSPQ